MDYQVFANVPSDFVYRAAKDIHGFALDHEFVKQELLKDPRLHDKIQQMMATSFVAYQKTIYRTVNVKRKEHIRFVSGVPGKTFFETEKRDCNACFEIEPSLKNVQAEVERRKGSYSDEEIIVDEKQLGEHVTNMREMMTRLNVNLDKLCNSLKTVKADKKMTEILVSNI